MFRRRFHVLTYRWNKGVFCGVWREFVDGAAGVQYYPGEKRTGRTMKTL